MENPQQKINKENAVSFLKIDKKTKIADICLIQNCFLKV